MRGIHFASLVCSAAKQWQWWAVAVGRACAVSQASAILVNNDLYYFR